MTRAIHLPAHRTSLPSAILVMIGIALLPSLCGCCAISSLGPCDENEVAARELARLGLDALHRGETGEARVRFSHALDLCPRNPQARHHFADLLWESGEKDRAIQEMELAVRNSAGEPKWTVHLGRMYQSVGKLAEAEQFVDKALGVDPDLASAWLLRGDIKRSQNLPKVARHAYHRCLSCEWLSPDEQQIASLRLAELYRLEGRPLRALATLERYSDEFPDVQNHGGEMSYEKAIALHALGRYEQAIAEFQTAQQEILDDPDLLLMLTDCQFRAGMNEKAAATATRLQSLAPQDPRVVALQADLRSAGHQFVGDL